MIGQEKILASAAHGLYCYIAPAMAKVNFQGANTLPAALICWACLAFWKWNPSGVRTHRWVSQAVNVGSSGVVMTRSSRVRTEIGFGFGLLDTILPHGGTFVLPRDFLLQSVNTV